MSDRSVGGLTRGVAHDLNNVLAAILGCADLLVMRLKENGPALEEAREIQKAAERGATLIQHLLALSPQTPKSSPPHPRRRAARSRTGSRKKSPNRR